MDHRRGSYGQLTKPARETHGLKMINGMADNGTSLSYTNKHNTIIMISIRQHEAKKINASIYLCICIVDIRW